MGKHGEKHLEDEILVKSSDSCLKSAARYAQGGFVLGAIFSGYEAQHTISTRTFPEVVGRSLMRYALPTAVTGAVFASTTCLMDDIFGKDTPVRNAAVGGFVAGAFIGAKYHNPWKSLQLGVLLAAGGAIARGIAVGGLFKDDKQAQLEQLNKTIYMSEIAHLGPQKK